MRRLKEKICIRSQERACSWRWSFQRLFWKVKQIQCQHDTVWKALCSLLKWASQLLYPEGLLHLSRCPQILLYTCHLITPVPLNSTASKWEHSKCWPKSLGNKPLTPKIQWKRCHQPCLENQYVWHEPPRLHISLYPSGAAVQTRTENAPFPLWLENRPGRWLRCGASQKGQTSRMGFSALSAQTLILTSRSLWSRGLTCCNRPVFS